MHKFFSSENTILKVQRGNFYYKQKDYNHAVEDYTRAIELSPKLNKSYFSSRGQAYEELGEYEKALADYEKAFANTETAKRIRQRILDKMKK